MTSSRTCTAAKRDGTGPCGMPVFMEGQCPGHLATGGSTPEVCEQGRAEQRRRRGGIEVESGIAPATGEHRKLFAKLATYRNRPAAFALDVLGVKLWSHQERALLALLADQRVAWRSCNGIGKTVASAVGALWRTLCWSDSLTVVIGPRAEQLRAVVWRAVRGLVRGAKLLRDLDPPGEIAGLGWRPSPDRLLLATTADSPEGLSGLHAPHITAICDEASAIDQDMHEALLGCLTGDDARLLLVGNPLRVTGEFHAAFHRKAHLYHTLHTSWQDVPTGKARIPGTIDERYVEELKLDYGELSSVYQVRALGEFPSESTDSVIGYGLASEARARWSAGAIATSSDALQIGVDVARYGDDKSCIVARRGLTTTMPAAYSKLDGTQLAQRVLLCAETLRRPDERPRVLIDAIGVGVGLIDALKLIDGGRTVDVVPIVVSERATDAKHERLRDQVWFAARDWLRAGGQLPPDDRLLAELTAPTFTIAPSGKLKVAGKDEIKARLGGKSPDHADAFALAVFDGVNVQRSVLDAFGDVDMEDLTAALEGLGPLIRRW